MTTLPKNCGTSPSFVVCTADKKIYDPAVNVSNNRLRTGDNYAFDSAGNTTSDAQSRTFVYDGENKQVEVKDASDATIGKCWYDEDGKRVKKEVPYVDDEHPGEITVFVYDAMGKLVAEYSTVVAPATEAKVAYLTNDHLGSARVNTDKNGNVTARHDYHPFGEEIATSQRTPDLGYSGDTVRKQFTGYERDNESNLDFGQARYYSSGVARFYSVDPYNAGANMEDAQSWNGYSYARSNPILLTDPDGKEYVYCDTNKVCVRYSDKEFQSYLRSLPEGYARVKGEDGAGTITYYGQEVATYTRPSVDFGSAFGEGVVNYLRTREPWDRAQRNTIIGAVIGRIGGVLFGRASGSARRMGGAAANTAIPKINMGKQGKHIVGHNNYIQGRSTLTANPQQLATKAGTGQQVGTIPVGQAGSKERVDFGQVIGNYVTPSGSSMPTTKGIIHYSNSGIHIIPAHP